MSAGHDDYQSEPIRGLPEKPPAGERILWQGAPDWRQLARDCFHIRLVAAYFAGLLVWRAAYRLGDTAGDVGAAAISVLSLLPIMLAGLGLLALLAYLTERTTVYTITNRRVVLRVGIALPVAINLPFAMVATAQYRARSLGTGDIPLCLSGTDRVAYSRLWPHVRPWRFNRPQPMLRAIPDGLEVASLLAHALEAAHADRPPAAARQEGPRPAVKQTRRAAGLQTSAPLGA